ncbi:MAG: OmpA family protein [Bacteroidetes bacterium]|nr:OmpA family protein [Bacteroidota bacterium]MBU1718459.1 OmpA family protein [Bacteroidota bacterium]
MQRKSLKDFLRNRIVASVLLFLLLPAYGYSQDDEVPCGDTDDKKARSLYEKALKEYKHAQYGPATQMLKDAVERDPEYSAALFLLGEINRKKKNYSISQTYYEKVVSNCPDYNHYAQFYLGQMRFAEKKYVECVSLIEVFIKDVDNVKNDKDYNDAESYLKYAKVYKEILENPVQFDPKPVNDICTAGDEYLPIISPDNTLALFTRRYREPPRKGAPVGSVGTFTEKFMMSDKVDGKFDKGEPMPEPFNQFSNEGGATLSIDNKYLYYSIELMELNKEDMSRRPNTEIYYSEYDYSAGRWGEIKSIGNKVNSPVAWDSQPSISGDGRVIYFTSNRKGGYGGLDIYRTVKNEKGEWGLAENLGPTINTPGDEKSPFIHTDSQTLYFASGDGEDGLTTHMGLGGYDLFYSRMADSIWTKPKNIGYPINTEGDEHGFFVSTDGKTGYFASNNESLGGVGGYDLYAISLYPEARPEKVLLITGTLKDEQSEEPVVDAKIELTNVSTKKVTEIPVDSISGKYALAVLFKDDYRLTIEKEGYAYNSVYVSQKDSTFEEPKKLDLDIQRIEVGETYKLNDIYFATNSTELTAESKFVIDGFIDFLIKNKTVNVSIHGHTDDVGSEDDNQGLSEGRAKSVYEYLITKGIKANRLSYKGYGESKPVATNDTAEGRATNRRTEFVVLQK